MSSQIPLASQFCSIRIYCFKGFVFFSNPKRSSDLELTFYFLNLSRFFTVQLSMSFCCAVLIYQRQLVYISISRLPCQELFQTFLFFSNCRLYGITSTASAFIQKLYLLCSISYLEYNNWSYLSIYFLYFSE